MRGCLISPETWVLDSPRTVCVACVIIYALNYGLSVVGPKMAMDFGSTKWNRYLVRGLPTDSPLNRCGTVKKKKQSRFACWTENGLCVL